MATVTPFKFHQRQPFGEDMSDQSEQLIKPTLHHVNLKTTRLQEMIDWYGVVVGATVNLQCKNIAFISNDRTHHRIALLALPGLRDDPEKFVHTGIHHTAFEYDSFDDLMFANSLPKKPRFHPC